MDTRLYNNNIIQTFWRKLSKRIFGCVSLYANKPCKGEALLSYLAEPFLLKPNENLPATHSNYAECREMAKILLDRGYNVDVIQWNNTSFIPKKKYALVIDIQQNLERLSPFLPKECIKIMHIVSSYQKFQNDAETKRLKELSARRGINLAPRRMIAPNKNIFFADYLIGVGNKTTFSTYPEIEKKIFSIPLSTTVTFPSPESKNFEEIRKNFVWIGGGGAVHKGLDLLLEIFKEMPEYTLTVLGPIFAEKDFVDFYKKEILNTKNIKVLGRISPKSDLFKNVMDASIALVYPSSSEGQSGSVITAMHAGLIPIISKNSGVTVDNFGIILENCSKEEIRKQILKIASMDKNELRAKAIQTWNEAQKYTLENFGAAFQKFIDEILSIKIKGN